MTPRRPVRSAAQRIGGNTRYAAGLLVPSAPVPTISAIPPLTASIASISHRDAIVLMAGRSQERSHGPAIVMPASSARKPLTQYHPCTPARCRRRRDRRW